MKNNKEMIEYLKRFGYLKSKKVEKAFLACDRKNFVPEIFKEEAYEDYPLPIGKDSTISAPHMVAMMTELLEVKRGQKILEIGTGSGWQACILSRLVGKKGLIVTVEIDKEVYEFGKINLEKFCLKNVKIILGDGSLGYKELAPYDRVLVTAAVPSNIPKPFLDQLKVNGIIVLPIDYGISQELIKAKKLKSGKIKMERVVSVAFVRLKGKYGFSF